MMEGNSARKLAGRAEGNAVSEEGGAEDFGLNSKAFPVLDLDMVCS